MRTTEELRRDFENLREKIEYKTEEGLCEEWCTLSPLSLIFISIIFCERSLTIILVEVKIVKKNGKGGKNFLFVCSRFLFSISNLLLVFVSSKNP